MSNFSNYFSNKEIKIIKKELAKMAKKNRYGSLKDKLLVEEFLIRHCKIPITKSSSLNKNDFDITFLD